MTLMFMRLRRRLVTFAAVLAMVPALAHAHAILVESQPDIGATVPAGAVTVRLRYNSRIDHARSRLTLNRPDRTQLVLPTASADPVDVLSTQAELLPGHYVIRWQVLAVDGHITRGDVPFAVAATGASQAGASPAAASLPGAAPAPPASPDATATAAAAR